MTNPEHFKYCNCICPEGLSYEKLEETLNRVRMLHVMELRDGETFCTHCLVSDGCGNGQYENAEWPCMTMMELSDDV